MFVTRSAICGTSACSSRRNGRPVGHVGQCRGEVAASPAGESGYPRGAAGPMPRWSHGEYVQNLFRVVDGVAQAGERPLGVADEYHRRIWGAVLREQPSTDVLGDMCLRFVQRDCHPETRQGDQERIGVALQHTVHHQSGGDALDRGPRHDRYCDGHTEKLAHGAPWPVDPSLASPWPAHPVLPAATLSLSEVGLVLH